MIDTEPRKRVLVSLNASIHRRAKLYKLNISQACSDGLALIVKHYDKEKKD